MGRLYCDSFVKEKGFGTTEDYLRSCLDENICPTFDKVEYFNSLLEQGLIKEGFSIRTSDQGLVDEHYWVTLDGRLEGAEEEPYPGMKGVFSAEEILQGQRISSFWSIESAMKLSVLFRRWIGDKE